MSEKEEIEEVGEEVEAEEVVGEAPAEETEAEVSDLLLNLDEINTMIQVTELWDSIVSGEIDINEAKKLLDRLSGYVRRQEVEIEEEEEESKPKKLRSSRRSSKKKSIE
ncbi:MAG: hypothetical protein RQ885_07655 [Desulfurococcales archaeon]|jgi:polyhydroxyalkanoate synthesis regulator phasin|nr:hypothetical protein [Desulfurococcales archaeon]